MHSFWRSRKVDVQLRDPDLLRNLYRRLLALRRREPALHRGSYHAIGDTADGVMAYERRHGDRSFIVALNFTSEPRHFQAPLRGRIAISIHDPEAADDSSSDPFELAPSEGLLIDPS